MKVERSFKDRKWVDSKSVNGFPRLDVWKVGQEVNNLRENEKWGLKRSSPWWGSMRDRNERIKEQTMAVCLELSTGRKPINWERMASKRVTFWAPPKANMAILNGGWTKSVGSLLNGKSHSKEMYTIIGQAHASWRELQRSGKDGFKGREWLP